MRHKQNNCTGMMTKTGGGTHEDESYNASQWDALDEGIRRYEEEDVYNAEEEADDTQVEVDPQSQDEFDEDDQDSYL